MKDTHDTNTIDALARGKGRPRQYESAAERQKAYRNRFKTKTLTYTDITEEAKAAIDHAMGMTKKGESERTRQDWTWIAFGILQMWQRIARDIAPSAEQFTLDRMKFEEIQGGE